MGNICPEYSQPDLGGQPVKGFYGRDVKNALTQQPLVVAFACTDLCSVKEGRQCLDVGRVAVFLWFLCPLCRRPALARRLELQEIASVNGRALAEAVGVLSPEETGRGSF